MPGRRVRFVIASGVFQFGFYIGPYMLDDAVSTDHDRRACSCRNLARTPGSAL
jgi:hypothetical protein